MKVCLATAVMALAVLAAAGAEDAIATIEYSEGPISMKRDGVALSSPGIGDAILDGDLLAAGNAATMSLRLGKATGMNGSIKVSPNTSFYFRVDMLKGERQGMVELISGQIGLKVKKVAGAPSFNVSAESAVCAVRGTDFEVIGSPGGSILVACTEGEVLCSSEGVSTSAVPGQAVEKLEGSRLARRAVALADYEKFKEKWIVGEALAFKRNAPKAARRIAARYLELSERLVAIHERVAAHDEAMGPLLEESRSVLATMERIAVRVTALRDIVGQDSSVMAQQLRPGVTLEDFFRRFEVAKEKDMQRIIAVRKAIKRWKNAHGDR